MAEEIRKNNSPDGIFGPSRAPGVSILTDRPPQESVYHSVGPLGYGEWHARSGTGFSPYGLYGG
jgi:hypothetical protein